MAKKQLGIPVIEFLKGRIYLGAYDFNPANTDELVYFTVEDALPYNPFHLDFGPLHMGHLYRFAVVLHNILNEDANQGKAIVFYSSTGPKERANAACLLCCYMVLVQSWSPHQVLQPISQVIPPLMPFRDAGYSHADFEITIQDIVYGVWRAKERGMIDLTTFNLEEFEQYERVDQGDLNLVSKDFIAFASPQQSRAGAPLNEPFRKVLGFFKKHHVKMVVRLNSHLYDSQEFTKRGIGHIDMIFDDGTCPTMEFVQNFIGVAEGIIAQGGKIAVHCKAGLGRTGCLIGAHLIYTHGFTANECIGYMRMIRPGMVVGPQQHWLYLHQNEFRTWKYTMVLDPVPSDKLGGFSSLIPYEVFKARQKAKYGNARSFSPIVHNRRRVSGRMKKSLHTAVPIMSPGQPRKGDNGRYVSNSFITNSDEDYEDIQEGNQDEEIEGDKNHEETHQQQEEEEYNNILDVDDVHIDSQKDHEEMSIDRENTKNLQSEHGSVISRRRRPVDTSLEEAINPAQKETFTIRADNVSSPKLVSRSINNSGGSSGSSNSNNSSHAKIRDHEIDDKLGYRASPSTSTAAIASNDHSSSSTPEPSSILERRRNRITQQSPSSWRVLRSITSPNSNKKQTLLSSSKSSTPISNSASHSHLYDKDSAKSVTYKSSEFTEESLDLPKVRSRSGARVRNRLASQSSINEKVISTGAIQKVSQRRKS